jgi:hypothetical protein
MNHPDAGPKWSDLTMEAALCVWEELLRLRQHAEWMPGNPMDDLWDEYGTCHMRSLCPAIGSWIVEAFGHIERDSLDACAYDWEIVPAFVALVDWGRGSSRPLLSCPKAAAKAVAEKLGGTLAAAHAA